MADNTTLNTGAGGDVIASDDIAGVKFQRIKLTKGNDGINEGDVSATNPLPTAQTGALPAGDNNIGNVDVVTLPALPAGSAEIGRVGIVDAAGDRALVTAGGLLQVDASGAAVPVTDGAGSLTVDGAVSITGALPAGDNNVGNVDVLTVPAPLSTTGGGTEATALRVTLANDSTGVVSVDDNAGSLTVDGTVAVSTLPALVAGSAEIGRVRITDGTDLALVSAAGALSVDGSGVTQPISAASLPLPAGAATSAAQLPNSHDVTVDNATGAAAVNVQDGGNSLTVDGTVAVSSLPASTNTLEVVGDVAQDAAVAGNPVLIGARASTAIPAAMSADGDAVHVWSNRSGAQVVTVAPHVGLNSDPWNLVHETAQYTTTQTSTVLVAGGASEKIVITKVLIACAGTTTFDLQLYFGTGAYSRGTSRAIFDGTFKPSTTLAPGAIMDGPFIAGTNGDDILVTTSANGTVTITVWYYVVT